MILHSFIGYWAPWLFPQFGCCEGSCKNHAYADVSLSLFFVVLEFELRAWQLARHGLYHLSHSVSPFLGWVFLTEGLENNVAWAGLKPQSS
jgi:hypothetical protein